MSNHRYGLRKCTLAEAREILRKLGISLKKTDYGEYRVSPSKAAHPELNAHNIEVKAYYANDLNDALNTGKLPSR